MRPHGSERNHLSCSKSRFAILTVVPLTLFASYVIALQLRMLNEEATLLNQPDMLQLLVPTSTQDHATAMNFTVKAIADTDVELNLNASMLQNHTASTNNAVVPKNSKTVIVPENDKKINTNNSMSYQKAQFSGANHELARKSVPLIFEAAEPKSFSCADLLQTLTPFAADQYRQSTSSKSTDTCKRPKLVFHTRHLLTKALSFSGSGIIRVPSNPSHWNSFESPQNTSELHWQPGGETNAATHTGGTLTLNDEATEKTMLRLPAWSLWENVCTTTWDGPLLWVLPSTTSIETVERLNEKLSACQGDMLSGCWSRGSSGCPRCQDPLIQRIVSGLSRKINAKFIRSSEKVEKARAIPGTTMMFDFWLSPTVATHIAHYTFKLGEAFELALMSSIAPIPTINSVLFRDIRGYEASRATMSPWMKAFDAAAWAFMPFAERGPTGKKILSLVDDFPNQLVCFERILWRPRYALYFHSPLGRYAMEKLLFKMLNYSKSIENTTWTPQYLPKLPELTERTLDDALDQVYQNNQKRQCPPARVLVAHRGGKGNGRRAFYNREEVIAAIMNVTGMPRNSVQEITMTTQIAPLEAISAWSSAGLIVTPHGSQLANIIHISPGSVIVEVSPTISKDFNYLTHLSGGSHVFSHGHKPVPMDDSLKKAFDSCIPNRTAACVQRFTQRLKLIEAMQVDLAMFQSDLRYAVDILAKQCKNTSSPWAK